MKNMYQIQMSYCVNGDRLLDTVTLSSTSEESLEWASRAISSSLILLIQSKDLDRKERILLTIERWCRYLRKRK